MVIRCGLNSLYIDQLILCRLNLFSRGYAEILLILLGRGVNKLVGTNDYVAAKCLTCRVMSSTSHTHTHTHTNVMFKKDVSTLHF